MSLRMISGSKLCFAHFREITFQDFIVLMGKKSSEPREGSAGKINVFRKVKGSKDRETGEKIEQETEIKGG